MTWASNHRRTSQELFKSTMTRATSCLMAVAVSAAMTSLPSSAAVLLNIGHDGTSGDENSPFDSLVLDGSADWTYTTDGPRSVMTALDNSASGSNRLILVQEDGVSEFTDSGTAADKGWVFEVEIEFLQGTSDSATRSFANFGVRSENGAGRQAWIGVNEQGGTGGAGRIGFNNSSGIFTGTPTDLDVDSLIGDGQYHNFKMYKYDNGGTTTVDVFMDGSLVLTSAYSALVADVVTSDIQGFASSTPTTLSEPNIDFVNFTLYDSLAQSNPFPTDVLVDINADGTNRTASVGDFEAATGLASGTFTGDSITHFNLNGPNVATPNFDQTENDIRIQVNNGTSTLSGDADSWFGGATSPNNLLEDGLFTRHESTDPSATITLSGSGLGLEANRMYELYLFAGRTQGHETTFMFDPDNPDDPSAGISILTSAPVITGDETLGTAMFTFETGLMVPLELVILWGGAQNVNGNQDAVFSGFALRDIGAATVVPEPETWTLLAFAMFGLGLLWRQRKHA